MDDARNLRLLVTSAGLVCGLSLSGCVAQQADLKQTERVLQQRIKQQDEQFSQARARQGAELSELREKELPQLRGELDRAFHQAQELQAKQEDLKQRSAVLEQQTKRLEQLASKLDADSANRYAQVRESLNAQDVKNKSDRDQLRLDVNNRLDEINKQMEALRKDIIDAVQKTNAALVKSVDGKLEEQRKTLADNQARTEQLSGKFAQFSQSLTAFRESLTALGERVGQEEQANKALAAKVDADTKAATAHLNETTKAMTGHLSEVNKSVAAVAQKLAARIDEQDQRLDSLNKSVGQVSQETHQGLDALRKSVEQVAHEAQARGKNSPKQPAAKQALRSSAPVAPQAPMPAPEASAQHEPEMMKASVSAEQPAPASEPTSVPEETEEAPKPVVSHTTERPDKVEYERVLTLFREGDLEGARRGFTSFLGDYPNSDLAPNARYWLGESLYGKKDYKQAIDAYDRVELDYPQSEKVPAAILKKGFAYLALKDKKRASSAFKQVVTLYPKSPEAGKAHDKLAQLKESR